MTQEDSQEINQTLNVLDLVGDKKSAGEFLQKIDTLSEKLYQKDSANLKDYLEKSVDKEFKGMILSTLSYEDVDVQNTERVEEVLTKMRNQIKGAEDIKVTLFFLPSADFIKKLYLWFKSNFGGNFLLDVSTDKSILGGAIVAYKGKYIDLSLVTKVESFFSNHEIEELLQTEIQ